MASAFRWGERTAGRPFTPSSHARRRAIHKRGLGLPTVRLIEMVGTPLADRQLAEDRHVLVYDDLTGLKEASEIAQGGAVWMVRLLGRRQRVQCKEL